MKVMGSLVAEVNKGLALLTKYSISSFFYQTLLWIFRTPTKCEHQFKLDLTQLQYLVLIKVYSLLLPNLLHHIQNHSQFSFSQIPKTQGVSPSLFKFQRALLLKNTSLIWLSKYSLCAVIFLVLIFTEPDIQSHIYPVL